MKDLTIDGQKIRSKYLRVDTQDRVGTDGYDAGAKILTDFFRKELAKFDTPELDPLGKQIIDCFMNGGKLRTSRRSPDRPLIKRKEKITETNRFGDFLFSARNRRVREPRKFLPQNKLATLDLPNGQQVTFYGEFYLESRKREPIHAA